MHVENKTYRNKLSKTSMTRFSRTTYINDLKTHGKESET